MSCGLEKRAIVLALEERERVTDYRSPNSTIKYNHGSDSVRSLHELKARTTSSCVGGGKRPSEDWASKQVTRPLES